MYVCDIVLCWSMQEPTFLILTALAAWGRSMATGSSLTLSVFPVG